MKAAEVIFRPSLLDDVDQEPPNAMTPPCKGITQLAIDSIELCDIDLKICLYNNIVLAGGTSMMKGFPERFDHEIRTLAESKNADISVHANLNRRNSAWIGGSMLASMSTFKDITLT